MISSTASFAQNNNDILYDDVLRVSSNNKSKRKIKPKAFYEYTEVFVWGDDSFG